MEQTGKYRTISVLRFMFSPILVVDVGMHVKLNAFMKRSRALLVLTISELHYLHNEHITTVCPSALLLFSRKIQIH